LEKNHDFFKSKKSDFLDLNQMIFLFSKNGSQGCGKSLKHCELQVAGSS